MDVTCPKGHTVEVADPDPDYQQTVGITTDGVDVVGVIEHDVLIVKCNAPVGEPTADGRARELCGDVFEVDLTSGG